MEKDKIEIGLKIAEQYGDFFAFDGCHKIYILANKEQEKKAIKYGYNIFKIDELRNKYKESCPLKFINSFDLKITFIPQY